MAAIDSLVSKFGNNYNFHIKDTNLHYFLQKTIKYSLFGTQPYKETAGKLQKITRILNVEEWPQFLYDKTFGILRFICRWSYISRQISLKTV